MSLTVMPQLTHLCSTMYSSINTGSLYWNWNVIVLSFTAWLLVYVLDSVLKTVRYFFFDIVWNESPPQLVHFRLNIW